MTKYELAKEYAAEKWDNAAAYSKVEKKDFIFTIREQREMCKQDFVRGFNAAEQADRIKPVLEVMQEATAKARAFFIAYSSQSIYEGDKPVIELALYDQLNKIKQGLNTLLEGLK